MKKTNLIEDEAKTKEVKDTYNLLLEFLEINQIGFGVGISAMLKLVIVLLRESDADEKDIDELFRHLKKAWLEQK